MGEINSESSICDYIDYKKLGRDTENNGIYGYWCEIHGVWVGYSM